MSKIINKSFIIEICFNVRTIHDLNSSLTSRRQFARLNSFSVVYLKESLLKIRFLWNNVKFTRLQHMQCFILLKPKTALKSSQAKYVYYRFLFKEIVILVENY